MRLVGPWCRGMLEAGQPHKRGIMKDKVADINPANYWDFQTRFNRWLPAYQKLMNIPGPLNRKRREAETRQAYYKLVACIESTLPDFAAGFDCWLKEYNEAHSLTLGDDNANEHVRRFAFGWFCKGYLLAEGGAVKADQR